MGDDALGSLYPNNRTAQEICRMLRTNLNPIYYDSFAEYICKLTVHRLQGSAELKKWINAIRDVLNTKVATPPSTGEGTERIDETASALTKSFGYAAKPKVDIPKFKGTNFTFNNWHENFENILKGARVPESDWLWIMNQSMEQGSTAQAMINSYVSNDTSYDDIVLAFGKYFDKMTKDKVLRYFNRIAQQKNEDVTSYYLRYDSQTNLMVRFGNIAPKEL